MTRGQANPELNSIAATSTRSYFAAAGSDLAQIRSSEVLGELVARHSFAVEQSQRDAWQHEIERLKEIAAHYPTAHFFFEFAIPRMGKRADVIVVAGNAIFVLEYKVGARSHEHQAAEQVLDYALDLKNFHEGSHDKTIVPIVVATESPDVSGALVFWTDGVAQPLFANDDTLAPLLAALIAQLSSKEINALNWARSSYKPTPTIIEAAQALYRGHNVTEISRSEAGAKNLTRTAHYISQVIEDAKARHRKCICFVTGVPGSGKTLAGLNIANERMRAHEDEHAVFLSGNGPLVDVLREALAIGELSQQRELGNRSFSKKDALRHASTFIQNIHHFRDDNLQSIVPPVEKVVVFDEAQRAWTKEQASRFMRDKRGRSDFNFSEPEFLISVMDRHSDWCVIVCLIGDGQEINTGEAGISGWLTALQTRFSSWVTHISDRLALPDEQGDGVAAGLTRIVYSPALHLGISVRSFRAEAVSEFIDCVIRGDQERAQSVLPKLSRYEMTITRDLDVARDWLRQRGRGSERFGLVSSSNALRLKPVGLHVKAQIDPPLWYLAGKADVRSSFALEDVATEFDVQGLELDWAGVCWDANLRWMNDHWEHHAFRGSRWEAVRDPSRVRFLSNAYRVLLTRARQGMVVFVPNGDSMDQTRAHAFYDGTYGFLRDCGFAELA